VTAVSQDVFIGRRHVGREMARIDESRATVIGSAPQVAPQRVSVIGTARVSTAPPARVFERQVTVRRQPAATPVSFEARRAALEANQGRPLDQNESERYRGGAARTPRVRVAAPAAAPQSEQRPVTMQPSAPERPIVVPREDRQPMRRPNFPPDLPAPRPRDDRPAMRTPAPRQEPAPAQAPPPAQMPREVRRPPQAEPPKVEAPPRMVERPRMERREQPRTERPPAAEQKQEEKKERSEERRVPQRGPKKDK
jgi:hypothetical protein